MEGGLTPLWRTGRRRPPVSWRPGSSVEEGSRRRRLQHRRQTEHLRTCSVASQTNKPPQEETEQQQLGGSGSLTCRHGESRRQAEGQHEKTGEKHLWRRQRRRRSEFTPGSCEQMHEWRVRVSVTCEKDGELLEDLGGSQCPVSRCRRHYIM